jgi:hypothetical protein
MYFQTYSPEEAQEIALFANRDNGEYQFASNEAARHYSRYYTAVMNSSAVSMRAPFKEKIKVTNIATNKTRTPLGVEIFVANSFLVGILPSGSFQISINGFVEDVLGVGANLYNYSFRLKVSATLEDVPLLDFVPEANTKGFNFMNIMRESEKDLTLFEQRLASAKYPFKRSNLLEEMAQPYSLLHMYIFPVLNILLNLEADTQISIPEMRTQRITYRNQGIW